MLFPQQQIERPPKTQHVEAILLHLRLSKGLLRSSSFEYDSNGAYIDGCWLAYVVIVDIYPSELKRRPGTMQLPQI